MTTEVKKVLVWSSVAEILNNGVKAGETIGATMQLQADQLLREGYAIEKPVNEVYAYALYDNDDIKELKSGDRVILADSDGSTYFHELSIHPLTQELCLYRSESEWYTIESLMKRYKRVYKQNMEYSPIRWAQPVQEQPHPEEQNGKEYIDGSIIIKWGSKYRVTVFYYGNEEMKAYDAIHRRRVKMEKLEGSNGLPVLEFAYPEEEVH